MSSLDSFVTVPDFQPQLTGSLVTLRPVAPRDREALFAVASDPLIWGTASEQRQVRAQRLRRLL